MHEKPRSMRNFLTPALLLTLLSLCAPSTAPAAETTLNTLTKIVQDDTTNTWAKIFKYHGKKYTPPHFKTNNKNINSACHALQGAKDNTPFYCPTDQTIYITPSYLKTVQKQHSASGNFALTYVIAHEVGHHVQNEWGILNKIEKLPAPKTPQEQKSRSINTELMADCLAGVWASRQDGYLYNSTIEKGIKAAINGESSQKTPGIVVAHTPSHGSLKQRTHWFKQGYHGKRIQNCNTF